MKRQSLWWLAAALFLFRVSTFVTVALLGRARVQRRRFYRQLRNLGLPGLFAHLLAAYWPERLLPGVQTAARRYEHGAP